MGLGRYGLIQQSSRSKDTTSWSGKRPRADGLTLPLDRDLIFVLMPDHKGRNVVAFSDGLQGAVVGFA
jgi:hypothetical protein